MVLTGNHIHPCARAACQCVNMSRPRFNRWLASSIATDVCIITHIYTICNTQIV